MWAGLGIAEELASTCPAGPIAWTAKNDAALRTVIFACEPRAAVLAIGVSAVCAWPARTSQLASPEPLLQLAFRLVVPSAVGETVSVGGDTGGGGALPAPPLVSAVAPSR